MTAVTGGDGGTIRVLHVDDDREFVDLAATYLEREDDRFVVETATSADEGLDRLAGGGVDCVVSDYEMPGRTGIEFLEAIREEYPDLPFILYTGKGSEEVASEAITAGVTDYLRKGTGTDQYAILAHRVSNAVEAHRSVAEAERRRHRLEQILKTVPGCVVQLNRDGEFVFANDRAEEVLGLERDTVTDRTYNDPEWRIRDLDGDPIPDEDLPFRRVLDTGEPLYGFRHRIEMPDGTERTLLVNGAPVFDGDGDVESVVFSLVDVTDREERARALESAERRLEIALEATGTGVWEWDPGTDEVVWSETLERAMGLEPGSFEGTFEAFVDRVHPDDRPDVERAVERALSDGDDYDTEFRMVRDDGEVRWVSVRGRLVEDGDGERMIGTHYDVTERKRRERELERTNRYLDAILENTTTPMFVKDAAGEYRLVNRAYRETFDLDESEIIGHTDEEIHPEATTAEVRDNDRYVLEREEPLDVEERIVVDGEARTYLVSKVPLYGVTGGGDDGGRSDGGPDALFGVAKDITERAEYERRLEALHDATGRLVAAGSESELVDATIAAAKEALDRPYSAFRLRDDEGRVVPAGVSDEPADALGSACPAYEIGEPTAGLPLARGEPVVFDDVSEVDDDVDRGSARAAMYLPVGDRGVLSIAADRPGAFDESDVALAEILAGHAATVLERVERTDELQRQNERLEEFASVVSHDLRSPLTVAQGRLELAREECESDHLDDAADAVDRSLALADHLLTLARQGERVSETEVVDLAETAAACWATVDTGGASIVADTDRRINADPNRLRQLLENLFRNAVEHGGPNVTVTLGDLDAGTGFYVEDDGPGIAADDRERVFEVGYSTGEGGTGVGLYVVREIAEAHGWEVRATEGAAGGARIEVDGVTGPG